jgi:hypothetical protein
MRRKSLLTTLLLVDAVDKVQEGDHWVTIEGQHVLLGAGGEVKAGNPAVVGGKGTLGSSSVLDVRSRNLDYSGEKDAGHIEGMRLSGKWYESLTESERSAIEAYRDYDYKNINGYLRFGTAFDKSSSDHLSKLDLALSKASLPETVAVYRGFNNAASVIANLKPGQSFTDKGFTSTTLHSQYAINGFGGRIVARIILPQGTKAGYVSKDKAEIEMLVRRGTRYTMVGREKVKGEIHGKKATITLVTLRASQ